MFKVEVRQNEIYKEDPASHYLEVSDGKFEGMHFTLGKIEFLGEDEEGNGKIQFDYRLLFLPEQFKFEEEKEEIENLVGLVLNKILENSASQTPTEVEDETGNSDTEQPSEE
jgi:hypothetical protein